MALNKPLKIPVVSMIFLLTTLMSTFTQGCVQTQFQSIENGGKITDLVTPSDEMNIFFGVGTMFQYKAEQVEFHPHQRYDLPAGNLSFPCFKGEFLWVHLVETDTHNDDEFFARLNCTTLQLGQNVFSIPLKENAGIFSTSAAVVEALGGYTFGFADATGKTQEDAVYKLIFNVTEHCTEDYFNQTNVDHVVEFKRYNQRGLKASAIKARMEKEEKEDEPPEVLVSGETLQLQDSNINFTSFVSDQLNNGRRYTLVDENRRRWYRNLTWYEIALPAGFLVIIVITSICLIRQCQKNSAVAEQQREALARSMVLAEQEGVEIPDDLKKSSGWRRAKRKNKQFGDDTEAPMQQEPAEFNIDDLKKNKGESRRKRNKKNMNEADHLEGSEAKLTHDFFYKQEVKKGGFASNKVVPTQQSTEQRSAFEVNPEGMDQY